MKSTKHSLVRLACIFLLTSMLVGTLAACSVSEVPEGYQYATCEGEYFRLYVPTQWTVNTESGVSGAFVSQNTGNTVTMEEVDFVPPKATDNAKEDLGYFFESHMNEIKKLKNFSLSGDPQDTSVSGKVAREVTYTATVGDKDYKFRQVLTRYSYNDKEAGKTTRYFVFTYSAYPNYYDAVLKDVDEILTHIEFYNTPYVSDEKDKKLPEIDAPEGMKIVSDNSKPFRFFAPDSWQTDTKNKNCVVYFSDSDRSNVSMLSHMPAVDNMKVEDFWAESERYYKADLDNYKLVSKKSDGVKLGDRDGVEYVYTYSIGGVEYKSMQVIASRGAMVYTMTYTALLKNYDAHTADVAAMQNAVAFR